MTHRRFCTRLGLRSFSGLILSLALLLNGCRSTSSTPPPAEALATRAGADPANAVETYLEQYQPGPLPRLFQTTRIYDRNGVLLAELMNEGLRRWVAIDQVSPHLINATISTEDATFYANSGIDPLRIARAALRTVQDGQITSGASTITMQLARNLFMGPEQRYDQSVDRKLLEAGLAQELTQLYSKGELLEMYLNLLNYGNLAYGPEAAAQLYFGKSAADLTLAEASLLAGIPQQPANLDPYRNIEATKRRQRIVLDLMVRHNYLTAAAADAAFAEPLNFQERHPLAPNLAPHFVQYVIETLDHQFGAGYTRRAGLNIYTTLDLRMQKLAQQLVARKVAEFKEPYDLSNAALVAMRPNSGEILAMVGSADFTDPAIAGQVNVALSLRQPGSAIKPVLYATALDENLISPATVLWDTPVTYTVGVDQSYAPINYDGQFHGPVTVRTALANSYNVPTVKLLDSLGVERMLAGARAMGLHTLVQPAGWYGLSLTLGGGEVTLLDLATAFHTLASGGQNWPATPLLSLTDSQARPLYVEAQAAPVQAIKAETAFLVTDILSDNLARTPAFGSASPLAISRPAAVKTGTTTDWRDNWTVGYTRYLVAGVWAGNSDGHPMQHTSGVTGAAPIWHDFMEMVLGDPELLAMLGASTDVAAWEFPAPATVERLPVCPPSVQCRSEGEYFTEAWLDATGRDDVLADSVAEVKAAPVYVRQGESGRQVGFCTLDEALPRTVLRMPTQQVGLAAGPGPASVVATAGETSSDIVPVAFMTATVSSEVSVTTTLTAPQLQTIAWTLQHASALNLGACDKLKEVVTQALQLGPPAADGSLQVLVDLAAANRPDLPPLAGDGAVDIAQISNAVDIGAGVMGGSYMLAGPIVHDNDCPGQYIMGRILNREGAPVAGVHVKMRDQWGNEANAVSKSGAVDYGMFDFPIPSGAPNELWVTVLDGAGNAASAPFRIPHRMEEAGDASCHHIVLQGR
ncbi:MAG: transglycosylase domain-containing protein [Caldilineaceae bacterium]